MHLIGVVEEVLVNVGDLTFPTDFYILTMENDNGSVPILLGRHFLKTACTKINVETGLLTMEFEGNKIKFIIYDAMKQPSDNQSVYAIDVIENIVQDVFDEDRLEVMKTYILDSNLDFSIINDIDEELRSLERTYRAPMHHTIPLILPSEKLVPFVLQASKVELGSLPVHLKYVFWGHNDTLSVKIGRAHV